MKLDELLALDDVARAREEVDVIGLELVVGERTDIGRIEGLEEDIHASATALTIELLSLADVPANMAEREFAPPNDDVASWKQCFDLWSSYVRCREIVGGSIDAIDALSLIVSGQQSKATSELSERLVSSAIENLFDDEKAPERTDWPRFVQWTLTRSLLRMCRQSSHKEVHSTLDDVDELKALQRELEADWVAAAAPQGRDAARTVALYHTALGCRMAAEYLLSGTVTGTDGRVVDVDADLTQVLRRSMDFAGKAADLDFSLWVSLSLVALWGVVRFSIWRRAFNVNPLLDRFIREICAEERAGQRFSLLPSQIEALERNVLDPAQTAVFLQMPTSSGKTLIAQFSILQTVSSFGENARILYLVPTRALVSQTVATLRAELGTLGIQVQSASAAFEQDPYERELVAGATGVVVTTPEKALLLLRQQREWYEDVALLVVDEAHNIGDGARGSLLELLLSTLRREVPTARMLLLAPAVGNAEQIGRWLGRARGSGVQVDWRPSRSLVGLLRVEGPRSRPKTLSIEWKEPHSLYGGDRSYRTVLQEGVRQADFSSAQARCVDAARRFGNIGPVLVMVPGSRVGAERIAAEMSENSPAVDLESASPEMRAAIAFAAVEYGEDSALSKCLRRGCAFHHSSLSPEIRFLIEDRVKAREIRFIAATTTLAQGMNFPVSTVVVHGVFVPGDSRPRPLTAAEFWNIAGRAGRVGVSDRGYVVFAGNGQEESWLRYSRELAEPLRSALLRIASVDLDGGVLKELYRREPFLRPFFQYLAHEVTISSLGEVRARMGAIVEASLAAVQATDGELAKLQVLARRYIDGFGDEAPPLLETADKTGLSSFSFDELFAKVRDDEFLKFGSYEQLSSVDGLARILEVLHWLPELDLSMERGPGPASIEDVAQVVNAWMSGASSVDVSQYYESEGDREKAIRDAGNFLYGKVSSVVSWGLHAFLRAERIVRGDESDEAADWRALEMLPAYAQFGVNSPEATVACLTGYPRYFATAVAQQYTERHGPLTPEQASGYRDSLLRGEDIDWDDVASRSKLGGYLSGSDVRAVVQRILG